MGLKIHQAEMASTLLKLLISTSNNAIGESLGEHQFKPRATLFTCHVSPRLSWCHPRVPTIIQGWCPLDDGLGDLFLLSSLHVMYMLSPLSKPEGSPVTRKDIVKQVTPIQQCI